ncbi:MAG: glycoside hydrolase family 5 protein [Bacteroidales bacterium]
MQIIYLLILFIAVSSHPDRKEVKQIHDPDNAGITLSAWPSDQQEPERPAWIKPDATGMEPDLNAIDFSGLMGIGWNLGNALESISYKNGVYSGDETSWGNPVITRQLIDSVKKAGFNAIRIPVAYSHMVDNQVNCKIKWAWKKRIEEVVRYVLDNDMYAIINIHWDGGWMNNPVYAQQAAVNAKIDSLWKQIAVYFRDYDDHLLFAGTNEVHIEGNYNAPGPENIAVQNSFNRTFVNTVRATGGRNSYRFLVVQGYVTNIEYTMKYMEMPADPSKDRLMAEVHYYDPYDFSLQTSPGYKTGWGEIPGFTDRSSWGQESWVDTAFGYMKTTFVDKGIPVILGEYGAIYRSSLTGGMLTNHVASLNYYLNYVTSKAMQNGMVPFYWDNGATGDNGFALFDRANGTRLRKDAISAIISAGK